jgi:hypothetical protein
VTRRKQRILQLVRQPARQFAPRRYPLGLNQALALICQLLRHRVEGARELLDFSRGLHIADRHVPISSGDAAARLGELLHRTRDARGDHVPEDETEDEAERAERHAGPANSRHQRGQLASGATDQQDAERRAIAAGQRNRVDALRAVRPLNGFRRLAAALANPRDQRFELCALRGLTRRVEQLLPRHFGLDVPLQQRAHPGRQHERLQKR